MPVLGALVTGESGEHVSHAAHLAVAQMERRQADVWLMFNDTFIEVLPSDTAETLLARWSEKRRADQSRLTPALQAMAERHAPPTQGTPLAPETLRLVKIEDGVMVNVYALAAIEQTREGRAVMVLHSGRRVECRTATFDEAMERLAAASMATTTTGFFNDMGGPRD